MVGRYPDSTPVVPTRGLARKRDSAADELKLTAGVATAYGATTAPLRCRQGAGLKLDKWLIENSILIGDFANALGVHRSTVQNWLSGRTVPSPSVLLRIEATTGGKVTAIDFITQQRRAAKRRLDPS